MAARSLEGYTDSESEEATEPSLQCEERGCSENFHDKCDE